MADPEEIGRALKVRFLLTGSVRIAGDRLRVAAHLIACAGGKEIWAERYDRALALAELFDIQTEIARTVAGTVAGRINSADAPSAAHRPEGLAAYQLVLQGLRSMHRYTREELEAARAAFLAAIEAEPEYGRPYGLLAMTEIYLPWYYGIDTDVSGAVAPAARAVELDERDTKGRCALGITRMMVRDHARAREHFETGLRMNGNDDLLLIEYGRFLMYDDRAEEGLLRVAEAMRLNPYHPNWYWNIEGRCLHTLGRLDEATAAFERVVNPPFWTLAYLASCAASLGQHERAAALRERLLAARPDFTLARFGRNLSVPQSRDRGPLPRNLASGRRALRRRSRQPGDRGSRPGPSGRCISTTSTQRPNLKPTDRRMPTWRKPVARVQRDRARRCRCRRSPRPSAGARAPAHRSISAASSAPPDAAPDRVRRDVDRVLQRDSGRPPGRGTARRRRSRAPGRPPRRRDAAARARAIAARRRAISADVRRHLLEGGEPVQHVVGVDRLDRRQVGLGGGPNAGGRAFRHCQLRPARASARATAGPSRVRQPNPHRLHLRPPRSGSPPARRGRRRAPAIAASARSSAARPVRWVTISTGASGAGVLDLAHPVDRDARRAERRRHLASAPGASVSAKRR